MLVVLLVAISFANDVQASNYNIKHLKNESDRHTYEVTWRAESGKVMRYRIVDRYGTVLDSRSHYSEIYPVEKFTLSALKDQEKHIEFHWVDSGTSHTELNSSTHRVTYSFYPNRLPDVQINFDQWYTPYPGGGGDGGGTRPPTDPDPPDPPDPPDVDIHPVPFEKNFVPDLDQYRVDYFDYPSNTSWYKLHFVANHGVEYSIDYHNRPSGIHYLTCNGTYQLQFFDSNDRMIGNTGDMRTSSINNPTCNSYEGQIGEDDLGLVAQPSGDGKSNLSWNGLPNADRYDIYKDGQKIGSTPDTNFEIDGGGPVTVIARDEQGRNIGQSDTYINPDGTPTAPIGECGACGKLRELLECPEWDEYMSEWENTIRRAIPPPPDWHEVARIFTNTMIPRLINDLENLLGYAPEPPSVEQIRDKIRPPEPTADTSIDLPQAENPFQGVLDFDISDFEEIEIENESPNFIFENPLDIDHNAPKEPIFPNDPRNHTGGIKEPEELDDYDTPIPEHVPENIPELPSDPVPTPSHPNEDTAPLPEAPNDLEPTEPAEPAQWEPERPYYKEP